MTNWTKFGIVLGMIIGWAIRLSIWGLVLYGIVMSIINHEVPYMPIILLFTYYAMVGSIKVMNTLRLLLTPAPPKKPDGGDLEKIVQMINIASLYRKGND